MSLIRHKWFSNGEIPKADDLNRPYDDLAADTVTGDNTGKKWATREHLDLTGVRANKTYWYTNTSGTFSTTSTTDVQIDTGSPTQLTINHTFTNKGILRVQVDGIVDELTQTVHGGATNNPERDLYQFIIKVDYTPSGGGPGTLEIAYTNYSFSPTSGVLVTSPPAAWPDPINYRNWEVFAIQGFDPGDYIDKIKIFAKVGDAGNTLVVGRHNISAVISEA